MEPLLRLRLFIWLTALGLWGVMVYEFLGEDSADGRMRHVANPFPSPRHPPADQSTFHEGRPSSLDYVKSPDRFPHPLSRTKPQLEPQPKAPPPTRPQPPTAPPGFFKSETPHFAVYVEGSRPSEKLLDTLESLHLNLMLDLAAFSPWAKDEKVSVFLFKNQETYRQVTGRPAWSGGASSVPKRKVYIYESDELLGILAHELCHIYYDGFFLPGRPNPLWLSEGMATLIQVERGLAAPNWLHENLEYLEKGGGYSLPEIMRMTSTTDVPDEKVRLWYAQSYSLVRFLLRSRYKSSFYKFSSYLREGQDVTQALFRSYGLPFNRVRALEYAWRDQLGVSGLSRMAPSGK